MKLKTLFLKFWEMYTITNGQWIHNGNKATYGG